MFRVSTHGVVIPVIIQVSDAAGNRGRFFLQLEVVRVFKENSRHHNIANGEGKWLRVENHRVVRFMTSSHFRWRFSREI
ncbi:hypothetical protein FPV33_19150 [Klebsiella aerogenes]|uniref:Uncharacterized protein n=1 Tax=Klebsiella aerogenes (strain ATCC 13048 / DSM 30053 / CCUG 1429 / JCM 1235 / KCTC 2190 / NBRC 13534 / NCIMB 10102 / NCTC 10006 / CDC 819-56) TaxID=1028307 RepID=A0A0H3FPJ2_KLEAK|nr:hypothetical protein EAE_12745 [Klebsiella aerogenes KCTC 2190]ATM90153.1 hypothetical protein CRN78_06235 [Klebsiella aerogenes]HBZ3275441.1 hypothetical protein [Klebsiella pneumoniae]ATX86612.1 hypothetical protein AM345_06855 [Klebsiella aerogenes]ATY03818.1 hypothetical protein AM334_24810 [Klebsiella aerogenes]